MSLENRIKRLEEETPRGYRTFDADGKPVIQSDLPGLEWFAWATELFRSRRETAKAELRRQLERSVGPDAGGGHLYELALALAYGPEQPPNSAPAGRAKR